MVLQVLLSAILFLVSAQTSHQFLHCQFSLSNILNGYKNVYEGIATIIDDNILFIESCVMSIERRERKRGTLLTHHIIFWFWGFSFGRIHFLTLGCYSFL